MSRNDVRDDWAQMGRSEFVKKIDRIEMTTQDTQRLLSRLEHEAAMFFLEQDRRLKHVEKLVEMLAAKGGATAEELVAVTEAVKGLGEDRQALSDAVNRSGIEGV